MYQEASRPPKHCKCPCPGAHPIVTNNAHTRKSLFRALERGHLWVDVLPLHLWKSSGFANLPLADCSIYRPTDYY